MVNCIRRLIIFGGDIWGEGSGDGELEGGGGKDWLRGEYLFGHL